MAKHGSSDSARSTTHRVSLALGPAVPRWCAEATFLLKVAPPLHGNLRAIEFTIFIVTALVGTCHGASSLSSITPAEVVEVPEGVGREDEIPDWQREKVDEHPEDVDQAMRGDNNKNTRQTENEYKEDQGNGRGRGIGESRLETKGN